MKTIRLAEWFSLILSSILILSMGTYLIMQTPKETDPSVEFTTQIHHDKIKTKKGHAVVPVEIKNESKRTVQNLKLKVLDFEVDIDYLPAGGSDTFFVIAQEDQVETLKVEPIFYQLDPK